MPSAKVLEEKQKVVADLAERIKSSAAGVLVNYQGITVADDTALRAELRKAGVNYTVIKNTLISKACDIVGFEGLKDVLSGMTAIATSEEDAVAPARIINDFAKKNENYTIKAGFVEGELLDVKGVEELAAIPTKDVLIARFMGSIVRSSVRSVLPSNRTFRPFFTVASGQAFSMSLNVCPIDRRNDSTNGWRRTNVRKIK